jgi:hypothetical protein
VRAEQFLPMTQSALKKQNGKFQPKDFQKSIFGFVPKSPTQMG